jgi:hypothetical protein
VLRGALAATALAALTGCGGMRAVGPPAPAPAASALASDTAPRRAQFPPTPGGIHLNLVFNYQVKHLHREIGVVDAVWGAGYPRPKQVYNQFYTPFERDGPYRGPARTIGWWKRHHPDWIEYRCDRKTVAFEFGERRNVPFDIASPQVLAYQRESAVDPALHAGYGGIDFDNLQLGNSWHRCGHFTPSGSWVQQYGGTYRDARYVRDVLAWAKSTYGYIHGYSKTATMIINFSYDGEFPKAENHALALLTDEVLDEAGFTNWGAKGHNVTAPGEWKNIVGMIGAIQANGGCYMENGEEPSLSKDITQAERLWVVANYLLVRDDCTYVWMSGFTASGQQDYGRILLYPEYSLAVGKPTGAATRSGDAWERSYEGGLALVNPSGRRVTVPLQGQYVDENGQQYSGSIVLEKTSGQILLQH